MEGRRAVEGDDIKISEGMCGQNITYDRYFHLQLIDLFDSCYCLGYLFLFSFLLWLLSQRLAILCTSVTYSEIL